MNNKALFEQAVYDFKVDKKYWNTTGLTGDQHTYERSKPGPYIKKAVELARMLDLQTVVEIGSIRYAVSQKCLDYYYNSLHPFEAPPCCNDGHGSIIWALEGFEVHTVDIDPHCIQQIEWSFMNIKQEFPENLHVHIPQDGIEFLKNFEDQIDVLYLDGWDVGTGSYQQRHLDAYNAAENKLSEKHFIIIDDTDFLIPGEGKDGLLTPHLINKGYRLLFNGRQTLFVNG